jgi:hypothetical protein
MPVVYDCIAIADSNKSLADVRAQRHPERVSPQRGKILLSPQRKTLNSALTKTLKPLSDEQVEAIIHYIKESFRHGDTARQGQG